MENETQKLINDKKGDKTIPKESHEKEQEQSQEREEEKKKKVKCEVEDKESKKNNQRSEQTINVVTFNEHAQERHRQTKRGKPRGKRLKMYDRIGFL